MIYSNHRWQQLQPEQQAIEELARELPVSRLLARLLINRGITTADKAKRFLSPGPDQFHDWRLLPDAEGAVARLRQARERGEKVFVHGDYDADGITATALFMLFFCQWGVAADYYIPHRIEDGYGLSRAGIEAAKEAGCSLLLTVDCGIGNHGEVAYARELGMDVIVTDHHLPGETLPPALAVVNPKRRDSAYPFRELAGVGVAFKLAAALLEEPDQWGEWLQLAALGTVADLVPLLDENRVMVQMGLAEIRRRPLPGLAALAGVAGCLPEQLEASHLGFNLGPRLNAPGRMEHADQAVALLLSRDGEADRLAASLDQLNSRRQGLEEEIFAEAAQQAEAERDRQVLVVCGRDWHPGVAGIVASRLVDKFYRPSLVLCGSGECVGSARSIEGFDIYRALTAAGDLLVKYGGHSAAAGLTVAEENLAALRDRLEHFARQQDISPLLQPVLKLDAELEPGDVDTALVEEISLLKPFGLGNPEPLFKVAGFTVADADLVGRSKRHLRLRLAGGERRAWAIGFGKANLVHNIDRNRPVELAASLQLNRWQGRTTVQLHFVDLRSKGSGVPLGQVLLFDRRRAKEPWLTSLAANASAVFFANSNRACRSISVTGARTIAIPPDNHREKVYNLKAEFYCFLEPTWSRQQLADIISLLPRGSQVYLFGSRLTPEGLLLPGLNLMRSFYARWCQQGALDRQQLISLLPADLAEPVLLDRVLTIFAQAGLARQQGETWCLQPVAGKVDLTATPAWARFQRQQQEYRGWLQGFASQPLEQLLA